MVSELKADALQHPASVGTTRPFRPCWFSLNLKGERPSGGWWGHTVNYINGKVYVSGGYGKHRSAETYCIDTVNWECHKLATSGSVPGPRDSHTCTTVGKNLLLVGGTDGTSRRCEVYLFDTESNEWKLIEPQGDPPIPREGHTACVIGTWLVIFGGVGEETDEQNKFGNKAEGANPRSCYLGDVVCLDMTNHTWRKVPNDPKGPVPRDSHAAAAAGNRLVVFGGDRGDQYLDDVWVFDMETLKWQQIQIVSTASPGPRAGHIAVTVGPDTVLVFGGVGADQENNNDIWILHLGPDQSRNLGEGEGSWEIIEVSGVHVPRGRFAHAADVGDGCFFVIGGCMSSGQPMDDFHILALTEDAALRVGAAMTSTLEARSQDKVARLPVSQSNAQTQSVLKVNKRENDGQPKKMTSYNLFCSHHRSALRDENPNLTPREIERLMGQKWSHMNGEEKKPYEDGAFKINASNLATFKAQRSGTSNEVNFAAKRQKVDHAVPGTSAFQQQSSQVCQIYSPNPSLLGAQVEGHVDGAFNSGYLATVRVNGFTYRALLFSPYLALPTPGLTAVTPGAPPGNHHEMTPSLPLSNPAQNSHSNAAPPPQTAPASQNAPHTIHQPQPQAVGTSHQAQVPTVQPGPMEGALQGSTSPAIGQPVLPVQSVLPTDFQVSAAPAPVVNGNQEMEAPNVGINGGG